MSQAAAVLAITKLFETADGGEQRTEELKRILSQYGLSVATTLAERCAVMIEDTPLGEWDRGFNAGVFASIAVVKRPHL